MTLVGRWWQRESSAIGLVAQQIEGAPKESFDAVLDVVDHARYFGQGGVRAVTGVDTGAVIPGIELRRYGGVLGNDGLDLFDVRK